MLKYQFLLEVLNEQVGGNLARLKCLSNLILGVIQCRSVNLTHLASHQTTTAKHASEYRKLQRFFEQWSIPQEAVAKLILKKLPKPAAGYVLSMDRTNWQFGSTHINILTVGIVIHKVAIPIAWMTLPQVSKRGNSSHKHRIAVMQRVLTLIPACDIYALTMDREFHGVHWLNWLNKQEVCWVLRIKANTIIDHYYKASCVKNSTLTKQDVWGLQLYFSSKRLRQEALYVVSNQLKNKEALATYKLRWGIEVLFGHLKKKGFNLEDTHLRDPSKIDKLIAIVSLSFLFTLGFGMLLKARDKANASSKRKSHFRYGLDELRKALSNPNDHHQLLKLFERWVKHHSINLFFVV